MADMMRPGAAVGAAIVILVLGGLVLTTGASPGADPRPDLPVCSDDSWEDDDACSWVWIPFEIDTVERRQLCDEDWTMFNVVEGTRYRIETSALRGGADTLIELWGLSDSHCGSRIAWNDDGGEGRASRIEWTAGRTPENEQVFGHVRVLESTGEYRDGSGYTLSITRIGRVSVAPEVLHVDGDRGATSDLWLNNPTAAEVDLELVFTPAIGGGGERLSEPLSIAGGETVHLVDVLATRFETSGSGTLEVRSPGIDIVASSRISSGDDVLRAVPVEPMERVARDAGRWSGRHLLPLARTDRLVTSLGLTEVLGQPVAVHLEMVDASGWQLGATEVEVPAHGRLVIDDVFTLLGVGGGLEDVRLRLWKDWRLGGGYFASARITDSISGATTYLPAMSTRSWGTTTALIPAAAADPTYRTDLRLVNLSDSYPQRVTVTFLPDAASGAAPASAVLDLGADQTLAIDDVVRELGGVGWGALSVSPVGPVVLASARMSTLGGEERLGQVVPTIDAEATMARGEGVLVALGLGMDDRTVSGVGWLDAGYEAGVLALRLVTAGGKLMAEDRFALEPWRSGRVPDLFTHFGVEPMDDARAELEVMEGGAEIVGYSIVVDRDSGDAAVAATQRVNYPKPRDLVVNTRADTVLVDRLSGAVGTASLREGTYSARVDGAGDLGADHLPLRVVCMYSNAAGGRETSVLGIGDRVDGVAGGSPFWCFIPDWIRQDDNTGAVDVILEGGNLDLGLHLDAVRNSVLLDRLREAQVVARTASTYLMEADGLIGRPDVFPMVLAMHKDPGSGELQVVVVGNGETVGPVARWNQMLVVGLDWHELEDNTGRSWLRAVR